MLCDTHRIQLLIQKILELPHYKRLVKMAQAVIADFAHSQLQLRIFQKYQQTLYQGKIMALVFFVITQWGTQYGLFRSLLRSKDAFKAYTAESCASLIFSKRNIAPWLFDNTFWQAISDLKEILRPIREAQKSSESDTSHVGHVTKRWLSI